MISAWASPAFWVWPSPRTRPSGETITQPTRGLGSDKPTARRASARACCMKGSIESIGLFSGKPLARGKRPVVGRAAGMVTASVMVQLGLWRQKEEKACARSRQGGFTLIELMITVAIMGILAAVAYPSYTKLHQKGLRRAAQAQMLDIANREQQFLLGEPGLCSLSQRRRCHSRAAAMRCRRNSVASTTAHHRRSPSTVPSVHHHFHRTPGPQIERRQPDFHQRRGEEPRPKNGRHAATAVGGAR